MRPLALFLSILMALQPLQVWAQAPAPGVLRVAEGTAIQIRPPCDIRSDKAKTGDVIDFVVVSPVVVNGVTIVDRGARASVTITEAKHASGFGQSGVLKLAVNSVTAVDGSKIRLRGSPDQKGGDNTALSVAGMLLFSVFFVFMQGREAVLKADKELNAYTDESKDFAVAGALPPPVQPQVQAVQPQVQAVQPQVQVQTDSMGAPPTGTAGIATGASGAAPAQGEDRSLLTEVVASSKTSPAAAEGRSRPPTGAAAGGRQLGIAASATAPTTASGPAPTSQTSAASATGTTEAGRVVRHVICREVHHGQPRRACESIGAHAEAVICWFQLTPTRGPRTLEVRWYVEGALRCVQMVTLGGAQAASWTALREPQGFPRGSWQVDLMSNGTVLSRRTFTVTF